MRVELLVTDAAIISATAATLAGLAGSGHCLAMCGGMAGAVGVRAGRNASRVRRIYDAGLYHVGRLGGYALAGMLTGLIGSSTHLLQHGSLLMKTMRAASGILIVLVALRIALRWDLLGGLERLGAHFWRWLRPLAMKQASQSTPASALALGFLWGWLPCGLVYSMLLFAAMSQSALLGANILFAYGVGTLPAMLGATIFSGQLQQLFRRPAWRLGTAVVLASCGVWTVTAALLPANQLAFCFSMR